MLLFLAVAHEPLVPARAKCDTWQVTHKLTPCLISLSRTVQRSELNLPLVEVDQLVRRECQGTNLNEKAESGTLVKYRILFVPTFAVQSALKRHVRNGETNGDTKDECRELRSTFRTYHISGLFRNQADVW